jgi:hypothetical protein
MKKKPSEKMKKKPPEGKFGRVVKTLQPLRDGDAGELRVRVIEKKGTRRLDIRLWVKTTKYTGYTPKGMSLSSEEFDTLISQRKKIANLLNAATDQR